jgi:hypothetical protein
VLAYLPRALSMALLGANYFSGLGCEFGADKVNSDFNDLRATSSSPRSWLNFFTWDKNSSSDYEQVEDRFTSAKTAADDMAGRAQLTQHSVSLDIVMPENFMEKLPMSLTLSMKWIG